MTQDDPAIPAATVILLRDRPAFEVLMICRHENSSFAGGALVFPGGRVDPGDNLAAWRDLADGLAADERMAAAQIAAIREAYEESGVLLARGRDGALVSGGLALSLSDQRRNVERDERLFLDLVKREGLRLACDQLRLFSHWVAPPNLHKRFDTLFFATMFPAGQHVIEDGEEATEALWIAPHAALAARAAGERKIIFPTARNLDLLALSTSAEAVFEAASRRTITPVMPQVAMRDGKAMLTIPEGLGYPVTAEALDLATRI